jgi:HEAT repeat protein
MKEQNRRSLSTEERRAVEFWLEALRRGSNRALAAHELYSLGVRTRGACRLRGSAVQPASPRLPGQATLDEVLRLLQTEASPEVRSGLASALAEWGGEESLGVLRRLVIGADRDLVSSVRTAALDAIAIIGGPDATAILEEVRASDDDPVLRTVAESLLDTLRVPVCAP